MRKLEYQGSKPRDPYVHVEVHDRAPCNARIMLLPIWYFVTFAVAGFINKSEHCTAKNTIKQNGYYEGTPVPAWSERFCISRTYNTQTEVVVVCNLFEYFGVELKGQNMFQQLLQSSCYICSDTPL